LKFFFRYVEGLPEETVSSALVFGSGIHAAAELWFNELMTGNPAPDQDTLLAAFWNSWQGRNDELPIRYSKNEDINSIGQLADRVLTAFRQSEFANPKGTIIAIEEELRGELVPGVPDLLGIVDLIVETEDDLQIVDLKTSKSRWSPSKVLESGTQLLLYGELATRLAPDKNIRLEFAVATKTKQPIIESHEVPCDPQQVERMKRTVEAVWRSISARHFYPAPSAMSCAGCAYRKPCRQWTG
jgi:putative RecB family exonuclease